MGSGVSRVMTGSFEGTGSALNINKVGFKPRALKLFNVTGNCVGEWLESMADGSMAKTVDSGSGTTDLSFITSNGITPLADGFTLGADADLNASGEVVHFMAWE